MNEPIVMIEGRHIHLMRRGRWEYAERATATGVVAVVAVTPEGRLLLTEQYRPPLDGRVIELPAGLAGDLADSPDEALDVAARRELLEETGYGAEEFRFLTEGPSSSGLTSEIITFFRAEGLRKIAPGGGDASENIQVHEIALDGVAKWLEKKQGENIQVDPKVYTGLYFLMGENSDSEHNGK